MCVISGPLIKCCKHLTSSYVRHVVINVGGNLKYTVQVDFCSITFIPTFVKSSQLVKESGLKICSERPVLNSFCSSCSLYVKHLLYDSNSTNFISSRQEKLTERKPEGLVTGFCCRRTGVRSSLCSCRKGIEMLL
jgi:hypothetical protein